jgi:hypothetical protein
VFQVTQCKSEGTIIEQLRREAEIAGLRAGRTGRFAQFGAAERQKEARQNRIEDKYASAGSLQSPIVINVIGCTTRTPFSAYQRNSPSCAWGGESPGYVPMTGTIAAFWLGLRVERRAEVVSAAAGLPSQFCLSLFCLRQWWASKRIGPMQWFLNLLEELEIECQIRAAEPRTQKRYRRDTELILKLLVKKRFPAIWMPERNLVNELSSGTSQGNSTPDSPPDNRCVIFGKRAQ